MRAEQDDDGVPVLGYTLHSIPNRCVSFNSSTNHRVKLKDAAGVVYGAYMILWNDRRDRATGVPSLAEGAKSYHAYLL